jgi:hypothetical protein
MFGQCFAWGFLARLSLTIICLGWCVLKYEDDRLKTYMYKNKRVQKTSFTFRVAAAVLVNVNLNIVYSLRPLPGMIMCSSLQFEFTHMFPCTNSCICTIRIHNSCICMNSRMRIHV